MIYNKQSYTLMQIFFYLITNPKKMNYQVVMLNHLNGQF